MYEATAAITGSHITSRCTTCTLGHISLLMEMRRLTKRKRFVCLQNNKIIRTQQQ